MGEGHVAHRRAAGGGGGIGLAGATGGVTGPHLHWAAYFGPVLFNPLSLLRLPAEELTASSP